MCLPVAVPAHPRILAGRRFLRISPDISGEQGVAGFSGDPIVSTQRTPRSVNPIVSTQRNRAAEIGFSLHKEFHKKNHDKAMLYLKSFRAARAKEKMTTSNNTIRTWKIGVR